MKDTKTNKIKKAAVAVAVSLLLALPMEASTNLGMVGIRGIYGYYLQAHTDGEVHASNPHRNEEETWFLIEFDATRHIYALYNWRNGKFLTKTGNCVVANSTLLGNAQKFEMISGALYGFENAVALRSLVDGSFIGTRDGGNDTPCGGEVDAWDTNTALMRQANWPGWWVFSPATAPTPGRDSWNRVGGVVSGIANKLNPADIISVFSKLLGS
jgi:hypothetical protein